MQQQKQKHTHTHTDKQSRHNNIQKNYTNKIKTTNVEPNDIDIYI